MQASHENRAGTTPVARLLLLVSAVFYAWGLLHPQSDFPNGSAWMDWSKMTDEGWYGSAAVQHFVMGRWYLPGSFNTAVAMPVWPVMLGAWFAVTGANMAAARILTLLLYGVSLALLYAVVRRTASSRAAALAVLITVVNPFCYAFDRLAVLEPVTVFWMMLALWLAGKSWRWEWLRVVVIGVVLCLLVLTKPTGVALVPAVLYTLWASAGWPRKIAALWPLASVGVVSAGLWLAYFSLVVRPQYLADYKLLFAINDYRAHLSIVPQMVWESVRDGMWIQPVLWLLGVWITGLSLLVLRELWQVPVFGAAVIAVACQLAYVGYHTNFQPRYYLVVAMPMAVVIALGLAAVWRRRSGFAKLGLLLVISGCVAWMAAETVDDVLHPEYSFLNAAQSIAAVVGSSPQPMLISDSGQDVSLFTGVPAVCESYTTGGLDALLATYKPGWYAAWPGWEDAQIAAMRQRYRLDEVARYRVFDDPKRQVLVLYKLTARKP
jgi:4-amino-4-deoxy-L-arabinose transferase-like glycosyltransferase